MNLGHQTPDRKGRAWVRKGPLSWRLDKSWPGGRQGEQCSRRQEQPGQRPCGQTRVAEVNGAEEGKEGEQCPGVTLGLSLHPSEPHFLLLQKWGSLKSKACKCFASHQVLSTHGWSKEPRASVGSIRGAWHTIRRWFHAFDPLTASQGLVICWMTPCASRGR